MVAGSVDSAKVGFDSSDAVSSLYFCLFDAGLNRTCVDSDPIIELIITLSKVGFYVVLEELIPMTRTDIVSLGVELFKLKFESLSSSLVSSRFIFPMNDLVSDFPNFIPVSPNCANDLNRPDLSSAKLVHEVIADEMLLL